MRRNGLVVFFSFFIIVFATFSMATAEDNGNIRYTFLDYKVENMPESFRFVPIHSDDGYADPADNGPIEEKRYTTHHLISMEYGHSWNWKQLDVGLGFAWFFSITNTEKRNYTNHPGTATRGYGAALTFVSTEIEGLIPCSGSDACRLINFTPKIFSEYRLDEEGDFRLGVSLSYLRFNAINGWDRYDALENNTSQTLAHIYPITAELTVWKYLTIGVIYNLYELTEFGEEAGTQIGNPSFTISIRFTSY